METLLHTIEGKGDHPSKEGAKDIGKNQTSGQQKVGYSLYLS